MTGLAAPAEHVNVTAVPAQTLVVEMFRETKSGLSAEKKDHYSYINFALLSLTQRNTWAFSPLLISILLHHAKGMHPNISINWVATFSNSVCNRY